MGQESEETTFKDSAPGYLRSAFVKRESSTLMIQAILHGHSSSGLPAITSGTATAYVKIGSIPANTPTAARRVTVVAHHSNKNAWADKADQVIRI